MSKIKKVAIVFILIEIIGLALCNIGVINTYNKLSIKEYKVDVSRAKSEIEAGYTLEQIDMTKYRYLVKISEFDPTEYVKNEYAVEEIAGKLYRFEYTNGQVKPLLYFINGFFLGIILLTIFLFGYLERKIISPFSRINSITTELSKGNLTVPIKQEKSKYFKDFLWGLDMLRDKLEGDKQRELELLKEKKLMILSLSHDIKTPLSVSDLYIKALRKNIYETEEQRQEALKGIEKNLSEIKEYVNEIAEASREEFLSIEVENKDFYLQDLLFEIEKFYKEKCALLHIDFQILPTENCMLYGDLNRMVEVVQNMMENAIKYGDGRNIIINCSEEEDCKLLTVKNSGNSLKEEELPHLFDSFYRGSNTEGIQGNGLGLYICKTLMHKMDGDIFAKLGDNDFSMTLVIRKV